MRFEGMEAVGMIILLGIVLPVALGAFTIWFEKTFPGCNY